MNWKNYLIGAVIVALIILGIIWYRNVQKNKAIATAKQKLNLVGVNPVETTTSNVGKTATVKVANTKFYSVDSFNAGDYTPSYIKNNIGEYAGSIVADKDDAGSTAWYKIINTSGLKYYVLKSQVNVK